MMIERSTKRKTTAVAAPTTTPATTSARKTPTVTPRTVADATANATSAGAGRGPLIAQPLSLLVMYLQRSSHAMRARKSDPHCSMGQEPTTRRSGHVRALRQPKLR